MKRGFGWWSQRAPCDLRGGAVEGGETLGVLKYTSRHDTAEGLNGDPAEALGWGGGLGRLTDGIHQGLPYGKGSQEFGLGI